MVFTFIGAPPGVELGYLTINYSFEAQANVNVQIIAASMNSGSPGPATVAALSEVYQKRPFLRLIGLAERNDLCKKIMKHTMNGYIDIKQF